MGAADWRVEAIYGGGYSPEKDQALYKVAGRTSTGSGCGMGERDHEWEFATKAEADACAARLREVPGVKVTVHDERGN